MYAGMGGYYRHDQPGCICRRYTRGIYVWEVFEKGKRAKMGKVVKTVRE